MLIVIKDRIDAGDQNKSIKLFALYSSLGLQKVLKGLLKLNSGSLNTHGEILYKFVMATYSYLNVLTLLTKDYSLSYRARKEKGHLLECLLHLSKR
jgi:hypothetical protein